MVLNYTVKPLEMESSFKLEGEERVSLSALALLCSTSLSAAEAMSAALTAALTYSYAFIQPATAEPSL